MVVINPSAVNMVVPQYGIDQIIGITSGTLTIAASGGPPQTATATFPHGFGDSAYFSGIFTADGGTTYNDFGAEIPVISGGFPTFDTVGCNAICDPTNLTITATNFTASIVTVTYKVYLFAKNTMATPITPIATAEILQYSSAYNFQKIFSSGTLNLTVSSTSTGSVNVAHNLGYVPKVRAFRLDSTSTTTVRPMSTGLIGDPQVEISTTLLTFYADRSGIGATTLNTNIEYRIYLDS